MPTLAKNHFKITATVIDVNSLKAELADERAGAVATFEGHVRNHNEGRSVTKLEYEACESLAEAEAKRIFEEAKQRFDLLHCGCVHRVGELQIGDIAVWVGVSSKHRDAAFQAARFIIDEIKLRLPIWKKETYSDGSTGWINCQNCTASRGDDKHAGHWRASSQEQAHD